MLRLHEKCNLFQGKDVTVTSVRKNTNVPRIGARLPLSGSLALGAQQGK
jgi:hypothetical protein